MNDFSEDSVRQRQEAAASLPVSTWEFVIATAALMALNALAIDIMLPALDDIAREFSIEDGNQRQLIIYVYILGFGAPQLVFGPLSDRFGRRSVLSASLIGYGAAGVICMAAYTFPTLLAARFLQGVFASGCRVVAVSVVRDIFVGRGMARIMSLVMTIFMVVPILAPSIGQLILFVAPWEWIFGVLTAAAILLLIWARTRFVETLPEEKRRPLSLRSSLGAYSKVILTPTTFGYTAAAGVIFGSLFAFIGSAEQVFTEVFHQEETFTLWFAAIAFTLSCANFTNSRLVEHLGMRRISHGALVCFTTLALTLVVSLNLFGEHLWVFFPLFALIFGCFGLIGSNFNALAMEPLGEIAGTASAAVGFATTTLASLIGWAIGSRYDGSVIPVVWGFFILGLTTLAIVLATERGRLFSSR